MTMWMDGDLLLELKKRAGEVRAGYQTFAQKILRDAVFEKESFEKRIERLEKALKVKIGWAGCDWAACLNLRHAVELPTLHFLIHSLVTFCH